MIPDMYGNLLTYDFVSQEFNDVGESMEDDISKLSPIFLAQLHIVALDLIPDFLPRGYIDDLAMMTGMVEQCHAYVTSDIECQVENMMPEWAKWIEIFREYRPICLREDI